MYFLPPGSETKELENGLKNKWRWQWLQEKDVEGKAWDEWCKKPKIAGSCFCVPCGKTISYSSNGKKALRLHGEDPNHKKNVKIVKTNQLLPGVSGQGHASVLDRCAELRAITSAFISENCLPFSLADRLVGYARRMGKDKHALEKVSISRTSATYVATHGVAKSLKDDLKEKLKDSYFSLNVDEATNNSNNKILNVLVQYFDTEQQRIVIDHLGSRQQNLATAKNLFNDIADVLKSYDLKWEQVISILMDNCSTMRGVRGGVETLCREENQHLLDISGDTVHMMNNIAKALLSEMDSSIPNLCDDLYYDIEESPKVQKIFTEVQTLTNIKFHSKNATQAMHLIRPISSRFLQLLAVITRVVALFSALTVYYYSFLTEEEKKAHSSTLQQIYRENKVSEGEQARISLIQLSQEQQAKSVTSNARKDRIISALFEHRVELMVKLNLYRGLLSVFEGYIKSFQAEKPLMHILLVNMLNVTTEILGMFILPEEIPDKVKDIVALDVTDRNIQKSDTELAVGKYAYLDLKKAQKNKASHYWLQPLYSSLRAGYVKAAIKLLKLPLANKTLRRLSSLDPTLAKHSSTPRALKALGGSLPNVIVEEEQGQLAMEASTYSTDQNVSALAADFTEAGRIDTDYWTKVFKLEWQGKPKYPVLTKLVCALLSIFSGPLVESSFNIMDDIIEKDRSALTVENYEAVATIKTTLKRKNTRAEDMVVNLKMKKSCINAYQTYQKHLKQKKEAKEEKQRQVLAASVIQLRKEKAKRISKLIKLQKLRRQEMAGVKRKSLVEPGKPRKIQKYKRIKLVD